MEAALFRIYEKFEDTLGKDNARAIIEDLGLLFDQRAGGIASSREDIREMKQDISESFNQFSGELKEDLHEFRVEFKADLRETELKLLKEIEGVRKETKEMELRLMGEIEGVRRETKDLEVKLTREINRAKIWMISSVGIIIAAIKALDFILQ